MSVASAHREPERRISAVAAVLSLLLSSPALGGGASFQGLGDLGGGGFLSIAQSVSSDGTTVVGQSRSFASGVNIEGFVWSLAGGMQGLGSLSGAPFQSTTWAVSSDGTVVVGQSIDPSGHNGAFRWTSAGGIEPLGTLPGGNGSIALMVSEDGSVIVGRAGNSAGHLEAFRWTAASGMVGLGTLVGLIPESFPIDMTPDGSIVIGNTFSLRSGNRWEAFRWTQARGMVALGDLPGGVFESRAGAISADGRVIVGGSSSAASGLSLEAYRRRVGGGLEPLGLLPSRFTSQALVGSENGAIIVGTSATENSRVTTLWSEAGGLVSLGDLPGGFEESTPVAVSNAGARVVGTGCTGLFDGTCITEPYLWEPMRGMRRLADALVDEYGIDLTGWSLDSVAHMSPDGRSIVGTGTNPLGQREAWLVTLPPADVMTLEVEPTTVAAGGQLNFHTAPSLPGHIVMTAVVQVNGAPSFTPFAVGFFDNLLRFSRGGVVPGGLAGFVITFKSFGFDIHGGLSSSNASLVTFL